MRCPACGSTDFRTEDFERFSSILGSGVRAVSKSLSYPLECRSCGAYYPRGIMRSPDPCRQCYSYERQVEGLVRTREQEYQRGISEGRQLERAMRPIPQDEDLQIQVAELRAEAAKLRGELEAKQAELDKALGGKLVKAQEPEGGFTRFSLLEVD